VIATMLKRWGVVGALVFATLLSAASAQILVPTVRPTAEAPAPAYPNDILPLDGNFEWAIPTSRPLTSGTGSPYAGGELKYDLTNAATTAQSNNDNVPRTPGGTPGLATYTSDWLKVARYPGDASYSVRCRSPIWGSPSSPGGTGSDHTRSEARQLFYGATNSGASKGDFKIANQLRATLLVRPTRFPDVDNAGSPTAKNNLTLLQLHPISDAASNTTFVILALRKDGTLEATMRNADGTDAVPTALQKNLLTNFDLGDLLWVEMTTRADRIEWRAENRTKAPGTIVSLTQTVPATNTSGGLSQRDRFQYFKFGCYHGTEVVNSTDAALAVGGVLSPTAYTDYIEQFIYSVSWSWVP